MLGAIVRSWKKKRVIEQVEFLLKQPEVDYIVVVINADVQNRGEENGKYTTNLLKKAFESNPKLIIHPVTNWGKNPGSAAALNEAVSELFYKLERLPTPEDIIFNISVESKIEPSVIHTALQLFKKYDNLAVAGVKRKIVIGESKEEKELVEKLENKLQYQVPQNTAAFWRTDLLRMAGGFRTECDFTGRTILIKDGEALPIAGMEDFPTLVFLAKLGYRWILLKENPIIWDLTEIKKDETWWNQNLRKINRQEIVMGVWSKKYFGLELEEVLEVLKERELK